VDLSEFRATYERITGEVGKVVVGQERAIHLLLTSILADGHVILTGVPGLGRTLIAETLGAALGLRMRRIQFTPDLLPTDVTGAEVVERLEGEHRFRYSQGPVFANMVLADEINRSPARTQAALLEAMQERQVTVGGKRHPLPRPFAVVATQNNLDTEGVYRLPEAQLDRFMMQIELKYPSEESEMRIIDATTSVVSRTASAVADGDTVLAMQEFAKLIPVPATMKEFAARLVRSSRWHEGDGQQVEGRRRSRRHWWGGLRKAGEVDRIARYVRWGASPRAGQALLRAAKVSAIARGRAYVTREDIVDVVQPVLAHRVIPDHRAGARGLTSADVLKRLVQEVCDQTAPKASSSRVRALLVAMKS
jgi:MoxR-like ATPase